MHIKMYAQSAVLLRINDIEKTILYSSCTSDVSLDLPYGFDPTMNVIRTSASNETPDDRIV